MYISINLNINKLSLIEFALYLLFALLTSNITSAVYTELSLDLNTENPNIIVTHFHDGPYTFTSYLVIGDNVVTRITDGEYVIWESTNENVSTNILHFVDSHGHQGLIVNTENYAGTGRRNYGRLSIHDQWVEVDGVNDDTSDGQTACPERLTSLFSYFSLRHNGNFLGYSMLDIRNISNRDVVTSTPFGNVIVNYGLPSLGVIILVTEGSNILWSRLNYTSGHVIRCIAHIRRGVFRLIYIEIFEESNIIRLYMANDNDLWYTIDNAEYRNRSRFISGEFTLDVRNRNSDNNIHFFHGTIFGLQSLVVGRISNIYITEVYDGDTLIWTGEGSEHITMSIFHLRNNIVRILILNVNHGDERTFVYFTRTFTGQWSECSANGYHLSILLLNNERTFNIREEPNFMTVLRRNTRANNGYISHITFLSIFIKTVMDNDVILWEDTDNEDCVACTIHTRNGVYVLLHIQTIGLNHETKNLYFKFIPAITPPQPTHSIEDPHDDSSEDSTPHEVTTSVPTGRGASSDSLPITGDATPGDRGGSIVSGPQVEPEADLREAEGEVNRGADGRTSSGDDETTTTERVGLTLDETTSSISGARGGHGLRYVSSSDSDDEDDMPPLEDHDDEEAVQGAQGTSDGNEDELSLANLNISDPNNVSDRWIPLDEAEHLRLSTRLNNEVSIDINNRKCYGGYVLETDHPLGLNAYSYNPLEETYISDVRDGEQIIWQGQEWDGPNEPRCTFVVVHYKNNTSTLVHLYIKTTEPSDGNRYFMKLDNGNWIQVSKEEFYTALADIDNE